MRYQPHDYQQLCIDDALTFIRSGGKRRLYASPTGTGKSIIELCLLQQLPNWVLLTPRIEIIVGMLDKLGVRVANESAALRVGAEHRIYTPIRYRNMLMEGRDTSAGLLIDESHHDVASTYQDIAALCDCPALGFTATPYRGTPRGTAALYSMWGEPVWVLTYPEAVERGVLRFPECRIEPLVDDDVVDVANGEFVVSQLESQTRSRLLDVVELSRKWYNTQWDKPTVYTLPTVALAQELARLLSAEGMLACSVTGEDDYQKRQIAFALCTQQALAICQVAVVGEGVDLPLRRLIDLSPSISPVRWLQLFGRITRPTDEVPEYVCCNRNLLRHAYLLEGCLPRRVLIESQSTFPPGKRTGSRVLGLESLGRFKATPLPFADGITGEMYALSTVENNVVTQYVALCHPAKEDLLWAKKENQRSDVGTIYGRWVRCDAPTDLQGFASITPSAVTEKQLQWWKRSAKHYGLDDTIEPNKKQFQALPVLSNLGVSYDGR